MKVLVTAASKHGSTMEIAEIIGAELGSRGLRVTVAPIRDVATIEGYDVVVLGSALQFGQWMKPARAFVERNSSALASRPVWLFSSGPVGNHGNPPKPGDPVDRRRGDEIATTIGARAHRVFPGRLDRNDLSPMERTAVRLAKAPDGDFRDWDQIRAWAAGIAVSLRVKAA